MLKNKTYYGRFVKKILSSLKEMFISICTPFMYQQRYNGAVKKKMLLFCLQYGRAALESVMKSLMGYDSPLVSFPKSYKGDFPEGESLMGYDSPLVSFPKSYKGDFSEGKSLMGYDSPLVSFPKSYKGDFPEGESLMGYDSPLVSFPKSYKGDFPEGEPMLCMITKPWCLCILFISVPALKCRRAIAIPRRSSGRRHAKCLSKSRNYSLSVFFLAF